MSNTYKDAADYVTAQKLELAARNLQHLIKIQEEQTSLENVMDSLQRTVIDAHVNNPEDLCDMMIEQTRILDGLFHYLIDKSKGLYTEDHKLTNAVKAQQSMVRTALAWKKLKTETYIKHKIIGHFAAEKNSRGTE